MTPSPYHCPPPLPLPASVLPASVNPLPTCREEECGECAGDEDREAPCREGLGKQLPVGAVGDALTHSHTNLGAKLKGWGQQTV